MIKLLSGQTTTLKGQNHCSAAGREFIELATSTVKASIWILAGYK